MLVYKFKLHHWVQASLLPYLRLLFNLLHLLVSDILRLQHQVLVLLLLNLLQHFQLTNIRFPRQHYQYSHYQLHRLTLVH